MVVITLLIFLFACWPRAAVVAMTIIDSLPNSLCFCFEIEGLQFLPQAKKIKFK